ncbi:hypothetical protein CRYUN_Cryun24cG0061400 [Craigia yunnanensis]
MKNKRRVLARSASPTQIDNEGISGGLALLWREDAEIQIQFFSKSHVDVHIGKESSENSWHFTGFYGHSETSKRSESWNLLCMLKSQSTLPRLCVGDFNEILLADEKIGGIVDVFRTRFSLKPNPENNCSDPSLSLCSLLFEKAPKSSPSMDDMAAYYPPPSGLLPPYYPYYQTSPPPPPPPPPPGAAAPLPDHSYIPQQQRPPPPFPSYSVPYVAAYSSHDSVRTLFLAGLPEDIKPREIYNLFREFPGYESSHLRNPNTSQNSQPFAFAVFSDQQSAIAAMQALNGMVFDLEKGSTLFIDFAKSNSRSKRPRTDEEWTGSDKKSKGSFSRPTTYSSFGSVHMSGMGNSAYNMIGYPPAQSSGNADANAESIAMKSSATPCPTLFVANLGANCTEEELIQVFSRCPGFLKLKMQSTYGAPVAFVDFQVPNFSLVSMLFPILFLFFSPSLSV